MLYGTSVIALSLRIVVRVYTLRRIYLDDAFLVFGFLCLTASTALLFHFAKLIYLNEAYTMDLTFDISFPEVVALTDTTAILDSFLILVWASIFSVKFSFLALFHMLIRRVSTALTTYYWVIVGACLVFWIFLTSEIFIVCPYFGVESSPCHTNPPLNLYSFHY